MFHSIQIPSGKTLTNLRGKSITFLKVSLSFGNHEIAQEASAGSFVIDYHLLKRMADTGEGLEIVVQKFRSDLEFLLENLREPSREQGLQTARTQTADLVAQTVFNKNIGETEPQG